MGLKNFGPNSLPSVLRDIVKHINCTTDSDIKTLSRPLHVVGIASKTTQEQFRRMLRTRKSKSLSDPHPQSTSQPRLPVANSSFGIRQMQWSDGEPKQKRKRRNDQIRLLLYTLHKLSVCFILKNNVMHLLYFF